MKRILELKGDLEANALDPDWCFEMLICEWGNYIDAHVDSEGNVWVESADSAFYLDDDSILDLINWVENKKGGLLS